MIPVCMNSFMCNRVELPVKTSDGSFMACYSGEGLVGLRFPGDAEAGLKRNGGAGAVPERVRAWHRLTADALGAALEGREPRRLPPLDLSGGTLFRRRVWGVLRNIRAGRTLSYGEIARAVGRPGAARAVGGACGANPIPVLVPCHRVLAADSGLGGFSGGLKWKRLLLEREGIRVRG